MTIGDFFIILGALSAHSVLRVVTTSVGKAIIKNIELNAEAKVKAKKENVTVIQPTK